MTRRYAVLDVFTETPLAGNPLAVVLDSEGLSDERMQAIAREFNLSETVFVLPAENPVHSARLRIFTPGRELPFAGHPTVGTAILLALERFGGTAREVEQDAMVILEETIGAVRCGVTLGGHSSHAVFDAPRLPAEVPGTFDKETLAGALGLSSSEIGFENHWPIAFDAGVPFLFVPVKDLETIAHAVPQPIQFGRLGLAAYLYTRSTEGVGRQFHARMFAEGLGVAEDPATGSAAVALAGAIHHFDRPVPGTHRYLIEQGFEMGRPSLILLEADVADGQLAAVRIGGNAVIVARGTLEA